MNAFLKGQIINEIKSSHNKIIRRETAFGEEMAVIAPTKRVLVETFNDGDKHVLKVGGETVEVNDKEFEEIMTELHICYASEMATLNFQDKPSVASASIFRIKKEK